MLCPLFSIVTITLMVPHVVLADNNIMNTHSILQEQNNRELSTSYCKNKIINFNDFNKGTIIDDQYDGVSISGTALNKHKKGISGNRAMIFNSDHPTGDDHDLEFSDRWGILILSEDGDTRDPDDNEFGGTFTFRFHQEVQMNSVIILDNEEGVDIVMRDVNGVKIDKVWVPPKGDNTQQAVPLKQTKGVRVVTIKLKGSGAIDDLKYSLPCKEKRTPPTNVKCSVPLKSPTSKIGKFTKDYKELTKCDGTKARLFESDAAGVWLINGGSVGGKAWAKVVCSVHDGSKHNLFVFQRKEEDKSKGKVEGFKCIDSRVVKCGSKDGAKGGPDLKILPWYQYAVVLVTSGQLGDHVEISYRCH